MARIQEAISHYAITADLLFGAKAVVAKRAGHRVTGKAACNGSLSCRPAYLTRFRMTPDFTRFPKGKLLMTVDGHPSVAPRFDPGLY